MPTDPLDNPGGTQVRSRDHRRRSRRDEGLETLQGIWSAVRVAICMESRVGR